MSGLLPIFATILLDTRFTLLTDHVALLALFARDLPLTGRLARWALRLRECNFDIKHVKGTKNVADFGSRCSNAAPPADPQQVHDDDLDADEDIDLGPLEYQSSTSPFGQHLTLWDEELDADTIYSMDQAVYFAINNYLRDQSYPIDAQEQDRAHLRRRAQQYTLLHHRLYRRRNSVAEPLREVIHEGNNFEKIRQVHEEFHLGVEHT